VRANVNSTYSSASSVLNSTSGSYNSAFTIEGNALVSSSYSSANTIYNYASGSYSVIETVYNFSSATYSSSFTVRNNAASSYSSAFDVNNYISGSYSSASSISNNVQSAYSSAYGVLGYIAGSYSSAYTVETSNIITGSYSSSFSVANDVIEGVITGTGFRFVRNSNIQRTIQNIYQPTVFVDDSYPTPEVKNNKKVSALLPHPIYRPYENSFLNALENSHIKVKALIKEATDQTAKSNKQKDAANLIEKERIKKQLEEIEIQRLQDEEDEQIVMMMFEMI
jgi:hypothetical protein